MKLTIYTYTVLLFFSFQFKLYAQEELIWLEAECADHGTLWEIGEDEQASNGKYSRVIPGTTIDDTPSDDPVNLLKLNVEVEKDGLFRLWARIRITEVGKNGLWFRIDEGDWTPWKDILATEEWKWLSILDSEENNKSLSYVLAPGQYTLNISFESDHIEIDKIFITSIAEGPEGLGGEDESCIIPTNTLDLVSNQYVFELFPNPATSSVFVLSKSAFNNYEIWDTNGSKVISESLNNPITEATIKINLDPGLYFIRLLGKQGSHIKKLMVK